MIKIKPKLIILLPHLDDEFAILPYLNSIATEELEFIFIFCAERLNDPDRKRIKRRSECIKSINLLQIENYKIIFLNDFFPVDDLKLYLASEEIFLFVLEKTKTATLSSMATTTLEGGHPDHDALALIAQVIQRNQNFPIKYFPIYNSRKTFGILPVSVLRPLKSQMPYALKSSVGKFCWVPALRLTMIYHTEMFAFLKIMPFIIFKVLFSNSFYYFNKIDEDSVNWEKSLSATRYQIDPRKMNLFIKKALASYENLHFSK